MSITVTLPWPPAVLSPNSRVHWSVRARAAKAYRTECGWQCKAAKLAAPDAKGKIDLWIDFYPPTRRHHDDDNLVARFKSGRDGIADALGIDDKRFCVRPTVRSEIGGMVVIRITIGAPE